MSFCVYMYVCISLCIWGGLIWGNVSHLLYNTYNIWYFTVPLVAGLIRESCTKYTNLIFYFFIIVQRSGGAFKSCFRLVNKKHVLMCPLVSYIYLDKYLKILQYWAVYTLKMTWLYHLNNSIPTP